MLVSQSLNRSQPAPGHFKPLAVQVAALSALAGAWERSRAFRNRLADDRGAVAIEYVIVAIALLAIAGAIAAALTTLGDDAVEQIPDSVSNVGS